MRTQAASYPVEIKPLVAAPSDPSQWPAWREGLALARRQVRERLDYRGDSYQRSEFDWVPSCYSCCFAMMCDQRFYDPAARRYTIEEFLNEGQTQFGGYDAVVLWHAYPRIGFDDRNQFDFYRDMPGGLAGLRELSRDLARAGRQGLHRLQSLGHRHPPGVQIRRRDARRVRHGHRRRRHLPRHAPRGHAGSSRPARRRASRRGPGVGADAAASSGSPTITCPGPSGSPTATPPACSGTNGSSGGT